MQANHTFDSYLKHTFYFIYFYLLVQRKIQYIWWNTFKLAFLYYACIHEITHYIYIVFKYVVFVY